MGPVCIHLPPRARSGRALGRRHMKRILQSLGIAVACCAASGLSAADYVISGEQTIYNILGGQTSALTSVSFTLTQAGTNWSISTTYTNPAAMEIIAMVHGCTYLVTTDLSGSQPGAGLVMDNLTHQLEGAPIFPRIVHMAFLTAPQNLRTLTNTPVPFLSPRHAGLHCYRWDFKWSTQSPRLPERVQFALDPELVRQVPADAVHYCFRSGYRDSSLFKAFAASQRGGAEYSVTAWTNWNGETLPLRSTFRFTTYDVINKGLVVRQVLVLAVTSISASEAATLIPALKAGAGVQHILNRTCYYYETPDGRFLSPEQAKAVGRVLTPAPPPPQFFGLLVWLRSFPWNSAAPLVLIVVAILVVGTSIWLFARFLLSKK